MKSAFMAVTPVGTLLTNIESLIEKGAIKNFLQKVPICLILSGKILRSVDMKL